jgi:hypothetical protein
MHEILHRPPVRPPRRATRIRLDDRLAAWESRHPVIAQTLSILIIAAALIFVSCAWWLVR